MSPVPESEIISIIRMFVRNPSDPELQSEAFEHVLQSSGYRLPISPENPFQFEGREAMMERIRAEWTDNEQQWKANIAQKTMYTGCKPIRLQVGGYMYLDIHTGEQVRYDVYEARYLEFAAESARSEKNRVRRMVEILRYEELMAAADEQISFAAEGLEEKNAAVACEDDDEEAVQELLSFKDGVEGRQTACSSKSLRDGQISPAGVSEYSRSPSPPSETEGEADEAVVADGKPPLSSPQQNVFLAKHCKSASWAYGESLFNCKSSPRVYAGRSTEESAESKSVTTSPNTSFYNSAPLTSAVEVSVKA